MVFLFRCGLPWIKQSLSWKIKTDVLRRGFLLLLISMSTVSSTWPSVGSSVGSSVRSTTSVLALSQLSSDELDGVNFNWMFLAKSLYRIVLSLASLILVLVDSGQLSRDGSEVVDHVGLVLFDFGEMSSAVGLKLLVNGLEVIANSEKLEEDSHTETPYFSARAAT